MLDYELSVTDESEGIVSLKVFDEKHPYLDRETPVLLANAVEKINALDSVRSVLIEGNSPVFCHGAPESLLSENNVEVELNRLLYDVLFSLLSIKVPTIAVMTGHGVGGGLMFGLWCDIVILAEEGLYGTNFVKLGFTPGMGATVLIEQLVGGPLSRQMLFTGRVFKGRELKEANTALAPMIFPRQQVRSQALSIASEIAENPAASVGLLKESISNDRKKVLKDSFAKELAMWRQIFPKGEVSKFVKDNYGR